MLPFITHEHSSLPPLSPPALRLADNGNPINHSNPRRLGGKQQQNTRSFRKTSTTLSLTSRLSLIFLVLAVYIFDAAHAGAGDLHNSMDLHSNMPISPDELSLDPGFFHPHGLVRRAKTTTSSKPASASTSASSSPTSAAEITFDNPTAFDSISLTQNLTSSCGNFLSYIVADTTFKNCLPLSGLIRVPPLPRRVTSAPH